MGFRKESIPKEFEPVMPLIDPSRGARETTIIPDIGAFGINNMWLYTTDLLPLHDLPSETPVMLLDEPDLWRNSPVFVDHRRHR